MVGLVKIPRSRWSQVIPVVLATCVCIGCLSGCGASNMPRPDKPVTRNIEKEKRLVAAFLLNAGCPPENFDSISYGMKGVLVAYCNKRGFDTSEIWVSEGIIRYAGIRASVQPIKKPISSSAQAFAALKRIVPELDPKGAEVTFETASKGSWDEWIVGQKVVSVGVNGPTKMAGVGAAFLVSTGQLLRFARY